MLWLDGRAEVLCGAMLCCFVVRFCAAVPHGRTVWLGVSRGTFTGPSYLKTPAPEPGSLLSTKGGPRPGRGRHGVPTYQGTSEVRFTVLVPCSLEMNHLPARQLVQYGHGLLGARDELYSDYLGDIANKYQWWVHTPPTAVTYRCLWCYVCRGISCWRCCVQMSCPGLS